MPSYDYFCEDNGQTVDVSHGLDVTLRFWAEVCYAAQHPIGDTDPLAPVRRILTRAPGAVMKTSNAELRSEGFTKLVKRDDGIYENVTTIDGEKRYMRRDDPDSLPHIHKKMKD